ncbi:MAG: membrane protein insertase YidC [Pseudomonadales bacterium]|nr:membrane protein insertase YidC [Pseudomonadales bacterium]
MDYKRFALIAALAIVSYLLLLEWNQDYPASPAPAPAPITSSETSRPVPSSDVPAVVSETGSQAPALDLPQPPASASSPAEENGRQSSSLITVTTPVHIVAIDLNGGDIVGVSLPQYPTTLETPEDPLVLLRNDARGIYIAQSGLIGRDGPDATADGRPVYQSARQHYQLDDAEGELSIDLTFTDRNQVNITKRFTFHGDDYLIGVQHLVDNRSNMPWNGNLFGQIKRDGLPDPSTAGGVGVRAYLGAALTTNDDPYKKIDFDDIDDGPSKDVVDGGWIVFSQHYFLSGWIPDQGLTHTYTTRKNASGDYIMGFVSPEFSVAPAETASFDASFYAGPKDQYRLEEISPNLGLTIDYGWLWFIASPIFWLLTKIDSVVGNYGWSIIFLTIIVKLLFSYLSAASYRSMAKMRRLGPQIARLKDQYGEDKQKLMQAQMELWRKEKVNPMGGCLPMLLQMPVLLALYWVLNESVELRHAPFILWYRDLSVMDPYFVLPLIMGATMFISQTLTPMTTMDPVQAKVMKFMPIIFTIFFLWFPAGLVLYWLVGNVFNIFQQWYINKKVDESYAAKGS